MNFFREVWESTRNRPWWEWFLEGFWIGFLLGVLSLAFANSCHAATGPQSSQIVLLNFQDRATQPCSPAYMADLIFNQYNGWIQSESHGVESFPGSLANVWGWYTLPHDTAYYCTIGGSPPQPLSCDNWAIRAAAMSVAPFDWYQQDLVVVMFPDAPSAVAFGDSYVGGCHPAMGDPPGIADLEQAIHEGGHVQGLSHANKMYCLNGDIGPYYDYDRKAQGCTLINYGNEVDPMGTLWNYDPAKRALQHYSAAFQAFLGWKQATNLQLVTSSQQVTLTRLDIDSPSVQEVAIPLELPAYSYSIEYRSGVGVLVNLNTNLPTNGIEELFTVNGATWPPIVTAANPFIDSYRGIRVDLLSQDATTARIYVNFGSPSGGKGPGRKRMR